MAESVTTVTLPQLADLSLNCPEIGSFNFNILHILLQVLIKQMDQTNLAVEFHGKDAERLQTLITTSKPAASPNLTEYKITGDGKLKKRRSKEKRSLTDLKTAESKEKELRVINRRANSKDEPLQQPVAMESPPDSQHNLKSLIVVEPPRNVSETPHFSMAISKDHLNNLEEQIQNLKEKYRELAELPGAFGLLEATRDKASPILDMFQILSLTKRIDAAETGMEKMAVLVEVLAKEQAHLAQTKSSEEILVQAQTAKKSMEKPKSSFKLPEDKNVERRLDNLEKAVRELGEAGLLEKGSREKSEKSSGVKKTARISKSDAPEPSDSITSPQPDQEETEDSGGIDSDEKERKMSKIEGVDLSEIPPVQAMVLIQEELETLRDMISSKCVANVLKDIDMLKEKLNVDGENLPPTAKIDLLESRFDECLEQVNGLDEMYNNQIQLLQTQMNQVKEEVEDVLQKMHLTIPGGDSLQMGGQHVNELYTDLIKLQGEMETITETATKLLQDKEERDKTIESIMEQIDLLKIIKANREDLEDALGDKADACLINRKVSHEQFETVCEDFAKGIEEALTKLAEQEELWQQALDDIQHEVGNKLDRVEVDPLKDFVNHKLKSLHEKFKALSSLKQEQEAAGTKSKFLRNVNCISCDRDVVMRREMDSTMKPRPHALPPAKNMAPYLAYELDQLRKQQKCIPGGKNLNFFENAIKGAKSGKDKDHICNRYCGGSHTTTTPQQRVTRLGHFLEQWGPEIAPVNDDYVRGTDKHMYRARDDSLLQRLSAKAGADIVQQQSKMKGRPSITVQGGILADRYKKASTENLEGKTNDAGNASKQQEQQQQQPEQQQQQQQEKRESKEEGVNPVAEDLFRKQIGKESGSSIDKGAARKGSANVIPRSSFTKTSKEARSGSADLVRVSSATKTEQKKIMFAEKGGDEAPSTSPPAAPSQEPQDEAAATAAEEE